MQRPLILILIIIFFALLFIPEVYAISSKCERAEKFYLKEDYTSAAHECEKLFRQQKRGSTRDEIAHIAGLSYLKLNKYDKANDFFEYVRDNSRDDLLKKEAEASLAYINKAVPSKKGASLFSIQVGSFKSKKNATRLYKRFKRRRYTVRVVEEKDGRVKIYKVKIGKFKTRKEALNFSKKLKRIGYQTAIVAY